MADILHAHARRLPSRPPDLPLALGRNKAFRSSEQRDEGKPKVRSTQPALPRRILSQKNISPDFGVLSGRPLGRWLVPLSLVTSEYADGHAQKDHYIHVSNMKILRRPICSRMPFPSPLDRRKSADRVTVGIFAPRKAVGEGGAEADETAFLADQKPNSLRLAFWPNNSSLIK